MTILGNYVPIKHKHVMANVHDQPKRTIVWLISIKQTKNIISKVALKPINHSIFND